MVQRLASYYKNIAYHDQRVNSDLRTGFYSYSRIIFLPKHYSRGWVIHPNTDELYFVVKGKGMVDVYGQSYELNPEDMISIRKGALHRLTNVGDSSLRVVSFSNHRMRLNRS